MDKERKIVQIIPATGWWARYRGYLVGARSFERPLVCWALMEDGEVIGVETSPEGIVSLAGDEEEDYDQFSGYVYRGADKTTPERWLMNDRDDDEDSDGGG